MASHTHTHIHTQRHTKVDTKPSDCDLFRLVRFRSVPNFFLYSKKNYNNSRTHTQSYTFIEATGNRFVCVCWVLCISHSLKLNVAKKRKQINKQRHAERNKAPRKKQRTQNRTLYIANSLNDTVTFHKVEFR